MRKIDLVIVAVVLVLFYIGNPSEAFRPKIEAQEEEQGQEVIIELTDRSFHVIYEVQESSENPIADILFLKRAAQLAIEQDLPYFNVKDLEISSKYDPQTRNEISVVEGIVHLELDAKDADYDAFAIEDLVLPHHSEY